MPFEDRSERWLAGGLGTDGWSNKVELCDVDGDGDLDAFVGNGAAYNAPDAPEQPFFWRNDGDHFANVDLAESGVADGWWRVVKCGDVDGDGDLDVFFGGTFQSRSLLARNDGGVLVVDEDAFPADVFSFGDAEFADIDGDLDLDVVAADWGDGDPFSVRGRPRVFVNDGAGTFVDETDARLPGARTGFSWDLEAVDVDNDTDLDLLVSCKVCSDGGLYLQNQGDGHFFDTSGFLPGGGNNYEFEVIDIDDDGDLDLFTINDGANLGERVLENVDGAFVEKADAFADLPNGDDDNAAVVFDEDNDGDLDVLVASLSGADRVFVNEGGRFTSVHDATAGADTPGTLGVAVGDLDGDGKLDLVMGQGEAAFDDHVFVGVDVAADTRAPLIARVKKDAAHNRLVARVVDDVVPARAGDVVVSARITGAAGTRTVPLTAAGELLFAAALDSGDVRAVVCAKDRGGHDACADAIDLAGEGDGDDDDVRLAGGGCAGPSSALLPVLPLLLLRRRRSRRRRLPVSAPVSPPVSPPVPPSSVEVP